METKYFIKQEFVQEAVNTVNAATAWMHENAQKIVDLIKNGRLVQDDTQMGKVLRAKVREVLDSCPCLRSLVKLNQHGGDRHYIDVDVTYPDSGTPAGYHGVRYHTITAGFSLAGEHKATVYGTGYPYTAEAVAADRKAYKEAVDAAKAAEDAVREIERRNAPF